MMPRRLAALTTLSIVSACTVPAAPGPSAATVHAQSEPAADSALASAGRAYAEANCSGCHAIGAGEPPNPQAPSFAAVANEMNFTAASLREFFVDGHELPGMMTVRLDDEDADAMTAYILSLRGPSR
jgi:mono/diheme cytochrome c family protein